MTDEELDALQKKFRSGSCTHDEVQAIADECASRKEKYRAEASPGGEMEFILFEDDYATQKKGKA